MKRKIVRLGQSTLVLSLPAKWSAKYSLKPGEELSVEEKGPSLVISTEKGIRLPARAIDLSKASMLIKRIVAAHYIAGYDEIKVRTSDIGKAREIQKRAKDFIGMSVVSQGKEFLELKEISTANAESFEPILKRIFMMLLTIGEESEKAVSAKEPELEYLTDMEANINNFTDYCFRMLNKGAGPAKANETYRLIASLEMVADQYKKIISYIGENKDSLSKPAFEEYCRINKLFREVYEAYYSFSYESAIKAASMRDRIAAEIAASQKRAKSAKEGILLEMLSTLLDYTISLLGSTLVIRS
jgi:phosphate uptake regulator